MSGCAAHESEKDEASTLRFSEWLERERGREADRIELSAAARRAERACASGDVERADGADDAVADRGWANLGDAPDVKDIRQAARVERVYRDLAPDPVGGLIDVIL